MTRRITVDLPVWQIAVAAGTAIICASVVGAGLAWGGVEYGRATALTPDSTERAYTADDLRHALDDCGAPSIEVQPPGTVTIPAAVDGSVRGCVLAWLEAPGQVQGVFGVNSTTVGDSKSFEWSNATVSWTQQANGRDMTITIRGAEPR